MPFAWLIVFFLIPFVIVLKISLSTAVTAQPPYTPVLDWSKGLKANLTAAGEFAVDNFALMFSDDLYWLSFVSSVTLAGLATAILLVLGYPLAYAMASASERAKRVLLMLVVLPFWTSFLIRVYAWIGILKPEGLLNALLLNLGLIDEPLIILNTNWAVMIGLVYSYLPFMVLPLFATLEKLDPILIEAAQDLGATPTRAFWRITVPLSLPGIVAGALLCFIPMVGEFVIPDLLGGSDTLMIGRTLWSEFFGNRDWPLASAVAILMLVILVVPLVLFREIEARRLERA